MKYYLFLLLVFTAQKSYCQDSGGVIGKWQVVVMDNGVRYDYKTGEHIVSKALQDSLDKWKEGGFNRDDYINWAGSCSDCYYSFQQGNVYQEFRDTFLRSEGVYKLFPEDSTISVTIKSGAQNILKDYKYYFAGKRLILSIPSFWTKQNLKMELERVD